ncbi:MAG: hypothetical protein IT190_08015, partial [Microbacteriaceae bacterium]|nr:hypothetical protein [Microbacteriaceae bacterium]
MLDFDRVRTPAADAETLVLPPPAELSQAVRDGAAALAAAAPPLLDATLAEVRRAARGRLLPAADTPLIVIGHQPGFIHAGVWAKHIVAARLAESLGGRALNLVVDNDAPNTTDLVVPAVQDRQLELVRIPFGRLRPGHAFDSLPRLAKDELDTARSALHAALGDARFTASQMPAFLDALADERHADWVDQVVAARKAIECPFGVTIDDVRVGKIFGGPLVADLLLRADNFRKTYNAALAAYRRANHVRSPQRPIPDLAADGRACETALWTYRPGQPRERLFVERDDAVLRLRTEHQPVAELDADRLSRCATADQALHAASPWVIRPRALALTLWARLLLADFFIHGIGGAKYDRITDRIITDFYGLPAPAIGCVSATLRLSLPRGTTTLARYRAIRHALHDVRFNPDRFLPAEADLREALANRQEAVRTVTRLRAAQPGDHISRRKAHTLIRESTAALHRLRPEGLAAASRRVEEDRAELALAGIAAGR